MGTTVNLKDIHFRVKDDTGRFVKMEDLLVYNINAMECALGLDWGRPNALRAGSVHHGSRAVAAARVEPSVKREAAHK